MPNVKLEKLYASALEAGEHRDYREAIERLTELLALTDEYPDALLYLGRAYHAAGELERAVSILQLYLDSAPDSAVGHFFLGRTFLALNIPSRAVPHLVRSLKIQPDFVPALSLLGYGYLKLKKPEQALVVLERALTLEPENAKVEHGYQNALFVQAARNYVRGDYEQARQMLEFLVKNGLPGLHPHLYLANVYRNLGRYEDALAEYDILIEAAPDDPTFHWYRMSVLTALGRTDEAARELEGLRGQLPETPQMPTDEHSVYRYLAWSLFREEKFAKSVEAARESLKLDEADSQIHTLMAESLRNLGSSTRARAHYERAIALDRNNPAIRYGYLMVLWEQGDFTAMLAELKALKARDGDPELVSYYTTLCMSRLDFPPEQVIPRVQNAIRTRGPDPELMYALASAYIAGGMPDLSLGWFRKVLALEPDHEASMTGLIDAYEALNDEENLAQAYTGYLERYPDRPVIRRRFIALLLRGERFAEAAEQIERNTPFEKPTPRIKRILGICYRKTDRDREAAVLFKELLRSEPSNREYLRLLVSCLEKIGNRKFALLLLEKALAALGDTADLRLHLGVLYYRDGKREKSLDSFRKAAELDPEDWKAPFNIAIIYRKQGVSELAAQFMEMAENLKAARRNSD